MQQGKKAGPRRAMRPGKGAGPRHPAHSARLGNGGILLLPCTWGCHATQAVAGVSGGLSPSGFIWGEAEIELICCWGVGAEYLFSSHPPRANLCGFSFFSKIRHIAAHYMYSTYKFPGLHLVPSWAKVSI